MSLDKYWEKRDFKITPEPRGEEVKSTSQLSYFIQRHHARRLHYDFRLELNGTLKSWAVPKGPSFNPADKRLAVHVEDHPLSYGTFEGDIPAHQYGAGHVVLWDKGSWTPIGDPEQGYKQGNLKFMLDGHKLHGKWALVRMQKASKEEDRDNWLLIKEKDDEAKSGAAANVTELRPESVAGIEDSIARQAGTKKNGINQKKTSASPAMPTPDTGTDAMPGMISPQLATLVQHAPNGDQWLCEVKYDGYRAMCRIDHSKINVYTRAGNDWTRKWPSITRALGDVPAEQAWLDGEVVALDKDGNISFQALQNHDAGKQGEDATRLAYYAFDLLYLNGHDISAFSLLERKSLLKELLSGLPADSLILYSDHIVGNAPAVFKDACKHGLEGIVVKQADAPYFHGRSADWQKVKCILQQEFVIGGYTDPEGSRNGFGALVLGVYDASGKLIYTGRVGTGFDGETISRVTRKLKTLAVTRTAFDKPTGQDLRGVHWVKPVLVAEVKFAQWTDSGVIRHASFIALRDDKAAQEITREQSVHEASDLPGAELAETRKMASNTADGSHRSQKKPVKSTEGSAATIAGVTLTHPDKILFSASQHTKLDLAQYYQAIEEWLMPHLEDRPLSLVRCPQGGEKKCFFQKHYNETSAEQIQQVEIPGNGTYMMANNLTAVIAMVQMGVLELHTWGSKKSHLMKPDRITLDLDPDPAVPWAKVIEAAQLVKFLLEEIGLASFVKTTGGKGLHIVAPIKPELDFTEIKAFSKSIAEHLNNTLPDHFVAVMSKSKRINKIFVDYLRNGVDATAVAAYSTRSKPDGPISTPIRWDELSEHLHADTFKLDNILERLHSLEADPWADYFTTRQRVTAKMIKIFK